MSSRKNVADTERWASGVVGAALATYGLKRRSVEGALLVSAGSALIARGAAGYCPVYDAAGIDTRDMRSSTKSALGGSRGVRVDQSVTIDRNAEDLFAFWRNVENLPRFMDSLASVTQIDQRRSHWVAKGPAGTNVEWDAEIINEVPNELIGWRTLDGADVISAGSVRFTAQPHGRGTRVAVCLQYEPPAGKVGAAVAWMLGKEPNQTIHEELRRFKMLMETGEVATNEGQPRGRRSMFNYA